MPPHIAKVVIDSSVPHLDHDFDYLIPDNLRELIQPGVRVRVPFRNRRVDGYVVGLTQSQDKSGKLKEIETLVSPEPVLTRNVLALCRLVAYRNVGNLTDVIRAAVPPRHKRAEGSVFEQPTQSVEDHTILTSPYTELEVFFQQELRSIAVVNLSWQEKYEDMIANLIKSGITKTIFLLPDQFDIDRLKKKFSQESFFNRVAIISGQLTPEKRYIEFLKVLRGQCDLVLGTRSAVFAPVEDLNSIFIFDDGDDLYASPQAPYWNARDVAIWRSEIDKNKVILVARAQSIEGRHLLKNNLANEISIQDSAISNRVRISDISLSADADTSFKARLPSDVFSSIRDALKLGSVLVCVPRKGYLPVVRCITCGELPKCSKCNGFVAVKNQNNTGNCTRCGFVYGTLNCRKCKNTNFRSVVFGIERTAEELGKAFPNAIVKYLDAETKLEIAEGVNQLIIATPGVEPHISYSGIVVLDSHIFLSRPEGNSRIRFVRFLMGLRSLLRENGELVIVGESNNPILQTFLKSDPTSVAELLLSERTETRFNPFARTAQVEGEWSALSDIKEHLPNLAQSWGPVSNEHSNQEKYPASILISVPKQNSDELVQWLRGIVIERSVNRKSAILVRIDPDDL